MSKIKRALENAFRPAEVPVLFKRVTVDNPNSITDKIYRIWGGLQTEQPNKHRFEPVSESDLLKLTEDKLIPKMVKSDSLLDLTVDTYATLVGLEHKLTAETSRTERIIGEVLQMLDEKNSPLSLHVSHIATSLICYGNAVVETEFEDMMPVNVHVVPPYAFEWRMTDRWRMGQYDDDRQWQEITSPNVRWESVNPLVGERVGRSPIITAIPNRLRDEKLLDNWSKIIANQAFVKRYIQIEAIKMKAAGYSDAQIDKAVTKAEKDIAGWKNLQPNEIPTSTDAATWNSEQGARTGSGAGLVDTSNRVYDRGALRGAKMPPFIAGSNEFTAETSSDSQSRLYSVRIGAGQEITKSLIEWAIRRFIRTRGNSGDPIYTTKHFDAEERKVEAEAFHAMVLAIKDAVEAGISLEIAFDLYESVTGTTIDAEIKAKIAELMPAIIEEPED